MRGRSEEMVAGGEDEVGDGEGEEEEANLGRNLGFILKTPPDWTRDGGVCPRPN